MLSLLIMTLLTSAGGFQSPGELPSPIQDCNTPRRSFLAHTEGSATRNPAKAVAGVAGYDMEAVKDPVDFGPPCTWTGLNLTTDQQALEAFRDSLSEPVNTLKQLSHHSSGACKACWEEFVSP